MKAASVASQQRYSEFTARRGPSSGKTRRQKTNERHKPLFRRALISLLFLAYAVSVALASGQTPGDRFDGPAELPRVLVKSSLADTPAPGQIRVVKEGDNLQRAIDSSSCGDTLKLQAGAVFEGQFKIPAKSCDDSHWVVIRTSASDESLPAEGTRLTPCYGGAASLSGRPDFQCSAVTNVLARIEFDGKGGIGPLLFLAGANHYRFLGLEITRANSEASVSALAQTREGATAHHIIFDRVWMHGTAQGETRRGVSFAGMTDGAVVDSLFTDFHCVAITGGCTDSQTIASGGGDTPEGPFKIVNNFLEAAGENLMFGGRGAVTTPADIEIRRNHLFKPMIWMKGQPGYVGGVSGHPFIVKNHFEMKNAQRVLFEDNLLENNWGGFSQAGFSILLTPKSQNNQCPACRVTDITIRSIKISNVGSVFQIANVLSDAGGASAAGERYSIHDVLVDGVHSKDYQGFGLLALVMAVAPPLRDVRIEHVTAFVPRFILSILDVSPQKIANFKLANNLLSSDSIPEIGSVGGGPKNCAFQPATQGPSGVFKSCFENSTFTNNLVIGGSGWPKGNMTPKNTTAAGLPDKNSNGVDRYRLCRKKDDVCKNVSTAIGAATDGKDIGADVDAIEKVMAEVK